LDEKVQTLCFVVSPFHGERKPSAGILLEGYGQCYSCEETFSLAKLVAHVQGTSMEDGISYIEEKFNVDMKGTIVNKDKLRRYDDIIEEQEEKPKRFVLPRVKLAPHRSGKQTHKYFFERGFTKKTVKECLIGWDRVRKRVTIPIFHPDGELAGIIGRAVLEQKTKAYRKVYGNQPKYYIYDNFPIGEVLYGSHEFHSDDDTAILVEGTLDRLWLRELGYTNVLSIIIAKMAIDKRSGTSTQAEILHALGVKKVVFMHDADDAGEVGKSVAYNILKGEFMCYNTEYPEGWKDPLGDKEHPPLTNEQVDEMLENKVLYGRKKMRRIE
jgi:5S rRNA maturation endonuclease (ribonuclease M5)